MRKLLRYVEARRGAPRDIILCGPRGNGKTVLLRWFQREIEALDDTIDVVWRTPSDFPSLDSLATTLVPPRRFESLLPDTLSVSIGIGRLGWDLGDNPGTLTELLALRCNHRPLILLVDEAHTLDRDVGRALLNASQSVAAVAPFLLALAGTPGLEPHLHAMSATFRDRARQLGIGRLDETAAAAALTHPLARQEPAVAFTDPALRQVIDESQGYPYFLQVWGAALWEAAEATGETVIDAFPGREGATRVRRRTIDVLPASPKRAGTGRAVAGRSPGGGCLCGTGHPGARRLEHRHRRRAGHRLGVAGDAMPGSSRRGRLRLEPARCRRLVAGRHPQPDAPCPRHVRRCLRRRPRSWSGRTAVRSRRASSKRVSRTWRPALVMMGNCR